MKHFLHSFPIFCCTLLVLRTTPSDAQWSQTGGPYGGNVQAMTAAAGGKIYLGTDGGGVFSSADHGERWTLASSGLPSTYISSLAQIGSSMFAGTLWHGIYRSTDGGAHWQAANAGIPQNAMSQYGVRSFASDSSTIYAAVGTMVYHSTDQGEHWLPAASGLEMKKSTETFDGGLVILGGHVFAGNYRRGIYHSTDHGQTWSQANHGLADTSIAQNTLTVLGGTLFVATGAGGIYCSRDSGANWAEAKSGLQWTATALCASGTTVYTAGRDTLFRWVDKAERWMAKGWIPSPTVDIWAFDGLLFCTAKGRLYRSADSGATWLLADGQLAGTSIYSFAENQSTLLAGTTTNAVFRTDDKGATWTPLSTQRVNFLVNALAFSGTTLIAAGTSLDGGIDISSDMGVTWARVTPGDDAQIEALAVQEPYVYAVGEGIWVSADNGATWMQRRSWKTARETYFGSAAILDTSVYAAEYYGDSIYVSSDRGMTWSPVSAQEGMNITCLKIDAGGIFYAGSDGGGMFRSRDKGKTWTSFTNGLTDTIVTDIAMGDGKIFAGTQDHGVFFMPVGGSAWSAVNEGLGSPHIQRLIVHGADLYAGTYGHGVWRRALSDIVAAVSPQEPLPVCYTLAQNFPNPFNPSTEIRYSVPEESRVKLTVYSVLGQEVTTLFNGTRSAGSYTAHWLAREAASGLYFYRLEAMSVASPGRRHTETKRMLLLR